MAGRFRKSFQGFGKRGGEEAVTDRKADRRSFAASFFGAGKDRKAVLENPRAAAKVDKANPSNSAPTVMAKSDFQKITFNDNVEYQESDFTWDEVHPLWFTPQEVQEFTREAFKEVKNLQSDEAANGVTGIGSTLQYEKVLEDLYQAYLPGKTDEGARTRLQGKLLQVLQDMETQEHVVLGLDRIVAPKFEKEAKRRRSVQYKLVNTIQTTSENRGDKDALAKEMAGALERVSRPLSKVATVSAQQFAKLEQEQK